MGRKPRRQKINTLQFPSDQIPPLSSSPPLSPTDIQNFQTRGFIRLKNAFPPETAAQCRSLLWEHLERNHDIIPSDSSTWVERQGLPTFFSTASPPWSHIKTRRFTDAIHQLCGPERWKNFGLGWWVINFPSAEYYQPPWGAAGRWHVDGSHYRHRINSRESGLIAMILFNDVKKDAGGTALSVGSHGRVARVLFERGKKEGYDGMKGSEVSREALKLMGEEHEIEQCVGDAGDVYLLHPFLVHARGKNLGKGVEDVRFMCNPNIELHRPMRFTLERLKKKKFDGNFTPVERAIVEACRYD